ncbi:Gfo/Idh/MocA family protein [Streptomyces tubercidicus]|uniref:Gfo/Idh/MocA family protein n=1 Tax=Streptomyces tubercidicus TaxID=47759 RepID=UPI003F5BC877
MTGPSTPRVLLVGAGAMGSHHGRVISESPRCQLAAVVDPAEARGRKLAKRFGADWLPEIGSLSHIDAVVVASSTDQHRNIGVDVLSAQIPLFMEKPLCASLGESREIVDMALRRGTPLMCGFIERFNPAVLEALSRSVHPDAVVAHRLSGYSPRMHTGVTWDLLVHDVDITLRLFDQETPKIVHAAVTHHSDRGRIGEDTVTTRLEFSDARTAALSASRVSSQRARRLTIFEQRRAIVADLLNPSVTIHSRDDPRSPFTAEDFSSSKEILERIDCSGRSDPLTAQWNRFMDLLEGKADAFAETHSILPSHETVAAILDSASMEDPATELPNSRTANRDTAVPTSR